jgi:Cys-rich repeat protein
MIMRLPALLPMGLFLFGAACGLSGSPNSKEGSLQPGAGAPVPPLAALACTGGKDCPTGQGCGGDDHCHADGECASDSDCASGQICYEGQIGSGAGICASQRPSHDPYCRADGLGACRSKCATSAECGSFNTCVAGYCHLPDECVTAADCGPNHLCTPRLDDPQYGFNECVPVPNPTCVTDPAGACRLPCQTDADCFDGGGCGTDHLCHASNECHADTDCPTGQICYARLEWGGLCGPPR